MEKKTYTVILASNDRGPTRSLTVSAAWLKAVLGLSSVFAIIGLAGVFDYASLLVESGQNKVLKAENEQLRRQFLVVESKLGSLETGLERVQNFTKKLKAIINIEDDDRSLNLALGPRPRPGQPLESELAEEVEFDGEGRSPALARLSSDASFQQKPPVEEEAGELARDLSRNYATLSVRIDRAVRETQLREQGVIQLWETLSERQSLLNATPNMKPARGWIASRFSYRVDPFTGRAQMHAGLDIAAPPGTPVYAPADGIVSYVGFEPAYGKIVSVDHGYGVVTRYAHNSRVFVEQGQRVSRRDVIAAIGSTGRSSGPHLHYEVRVNGVPVDPENYLLDEDSF